MEGYSSEEETLGGYRSQSVSGVDSNTNTVASDGSARSTAVAVPRQTPRRYQSIRNRRMNATQPGSEDEDATAQRNPVVVVTRAARRKAKESPQPRRRAADVEAPIQEDSDASDSDAEAEFEYNEEPRRNFMFGMYSIHCACFIIIVATLLVLGLVFAMGGSPMFNGGLAVVPCDNATLPAGVSPRSAQGRDVLWCDGPSVQAAFMVNVAWYGVYCFAVMVNWAGFRKMYMKRRNRARSVLQGVVCGPLTVFGVMHYSGAAPSSREVALAAVAAALVSVQGFTHDKISHRRGVVENVSEAWGVRVLDALAGVWARVRFLVEPHVLVDVASTLLFTMLFLPVARDTEPGPYARSLDGSMSALPWLVVVCAWAGVALRTVSVFVDPGIYEFCGLLLTWLVVYAPLLISAAAPQVHRSNR